MRAARPAHLLSLHLTVLILSDDRPQFTEAAVYDCLELKGHLELVLQTDSWVKILMSMSGRSNGANRYSLLKTLPLSYVTLRYAIRYLVPF